MKLVSKQTKRKITPKLSALLIALTSVFFVVACGGGASSVGSDSADSGSSASSSSGSSGSSATSGTGGSSSSGTSGTSGSSGTSGTSGSDDDDCTSIPVSNPSIGMAKDGGRDDDDSDEDDDDDDDDCSAPATPLPPLSAADLAAGTLGKTLWTANCFSCHGSDTHEVRTGNRIMNAIAENKGGMRALSGVITETDAKNIAIYANNRKAF